MPIEAMISQRPDDQKAWPAAVPNNVRAGASCDASHLVNQLMEACRIESGVVIIPQWALFQMAADLEHIRSTGWICEKPENNR